MKNAPIPQSDIIWHLKSRKCLVLGLWTLGAYHWLQQRNGGISQMHEGGSCFVYKHYK